MRFTTSIDKRKRHVSIISVHRSILVLFLHYFIFTTLYIQTAEMDVDNSLHSSIYTNTTSNLEIPSQEKISSPPRIRHHQYRSLRFASLNRFLVAVSSSTSLNDLTRHVLNSPNATTHRSRYHRNTRQCSPLLCGDWEEGETNECPMERLRRQQMADSTARQCVHVVGDGTNASKIGEVIVDANESLELFTTFCASRHLYCRPQPEIIPVNKLCKMTLNFHYIPDYAVLHRCPSTVPCCGEDTRCVPLPDSIRNVTFSFYVLESSGSMMTSQVEWHSVETFTFENHTACNCTQIKSELNDDRVIETNVGIQNSTQSNGLKSKASRRRKHVCTRCPKPFICNPKIKINRCKCQCKSDDSSCKEIMKGLRPLNKTQQKCVRSELCFEPKCAKKFIYSRRKGRCVELESKLNNERGDKFFVAEHLSELEENKITVQKENDELHNGINEEKIDKLSSDDLTDNFFRGTTDDLVIETDIEQINQEHEILTQN